MANRKKPKNQQSNKSRAIYKVVDFIEKPNSSNNQFEKIIAELAKDNPGIDPKKVKKFPDT